MYSLPVKYMFHNVQYSTVHVFVNVCVSVHTCVFECMLACLCICLRLVIVYDESLEEDIKDDTDGDLQEALLALCKVSDTNHVLMLLTAHENAGPLETGCLDITFIYIAVG